MASIPKDEEFSKCYFQLLVFDKEWICSRTNKDLPYPAKIVYGKREDLKAYYDLEDLSLPTKGAKVEEDFVKPRTGRSVRYLLTTRLLSQMIALTWLDGREDIPGYTSEQIDLIENTWKFHNVLPDFYFLHSDPEDSTQYVLKPFDEFTLGQLLIESIEDPSCMSNDIEDPSCMSNDEDYSSKPPGVSHEAMAFIKTSTSRGFFALRIALLLAGQAYYADCSGKYKAICESIFSTTEIVEVFAFSDVPWDKFTGGTLEIAGNIPPHTVVTLPYPPRPSDYNLKEDHIRRWAVAPLDADSEFPFYPQNPSLDWTFSRPQFVTSPYPYIPVSTC